MPPLLQQLPRLQRLQEPNLKHRPNRKLNQLVQLPQLRQLKLQKHLQPRRPMQRPQLKFVQKVLQLVLPRLKQKPVPYQEMYYPTPAKRPKPPAGHKTDTASTPKVCRKRFDKQFSQEKGTFCYGLPFLHKPNRRNKDVLPPVTPV